MITQMKLFQSLALLLLVLVPILGHSWQVDSPGVIRCLERERQALLKFKDELVDTYGRLSSWGNHQPDCCKWTGVHCHNRSNHVTRLDLHNPWVENGSAYAPLQGTISTPLLELQNLYYLNLSFNDFGYAPIPEFIGSLTKLRYLDLGFSNFSGPIPHHVGNLSKLLHLNLGSNENCYCKSLDWFSHLHSLEYLDLSYTNLSEATDWVHAVSTLNSIKELHLSSALPEIPPVLPAINRSAPLATLDLSMNNLYLSSPLTLISWFSNFSSTGLTSIDLSDNRIHGGIPGFFGNMSSLVDLDLSKNNVTADLSELMMNLSGPIERALQVLDLSGNNISGSFGNISKFSSLRVLDLSENQLNGSIGEGYLRLPSLVVLDLSSNQLTGSLHLQLPNLVVLDLSSNQFTGSVPDVSLSSSLKQLVIEFNMFNGTLTESIGRLSKLEELLIGSNRLEGVITEAHMFNLSRLQRLDLSFNSLLEVKPSDEWLPPFQLLFLHMSHCKLGPYFPRWLKTQKEIVKIDISNSRISDNIHGWFGGIAPQLAYLNVSNNQMYGTFPHFPSSKITSGDSSVSSFDGGYGKVLDLSGNNISGPITFLCQTRKWVLLDLSDNQFSDRIPDCFANFEMLMYLNLANNNLYGERTFSFGSLSALSLLHLRNNTFSGGLPTSLRNCTSLTMIDLGENRLTGKIPPWIGNSFPELKVLVLRSNEFYGSIPSNICGLTNIRILDISSNNFSGATPQCFHDFTAMTKTWTEGDDLLDNYGWITGSVYAVNLKSFNYAYFMWKGMEVKYTNNVSLVKLIDLSSNNLTGQIPPDITKLIGLVALNLSRNNLVGLIPRDIGQLKSLDSLDFSRNRLSGRIPVSLGELSYLGVLNLSYNNLSGRIPPVTKLMTFQEAYVGNPGLCGLPLNKPCLADKESDQDGNNTTSKEEFVDDDEFISKGFYISLAVGFVVGFWGAFGTILLNRASRHAYFMAVDAVADFVCVRMELSKARLLRHFRNHG